MQTKISLKNSLIMGIIIPKITLSNTFTHTRNRALELFNSKLESFHIRHANGITFNISWYEKKKIKGVTSRLNGDLMSLGTSHGT